MDTDTHGFYRNEGNEEGGMRGLQERTKNLRTPDSGVLHAAAQAAFASDGGKRRESAHSPESFRGFARFGYGLAILLLGWRALGDDDDVLRRGRRAADGVDRRRDVDPVAVGH